jgi:hypothetical protein
MVPRYGKGATGVPADGEKSKPRQEGGSSKAF